MKSTPIFRQRLAWFFVAVLVLGTALVACVRPVPRDDEPAPTTAVQPTTETEALPTPVVPDATEEAPAEGDAPAEATEVPAEEPAEEPTDEAPAAEPTAVPETTSPPTEDVTHTVQAGETLYRISQQYGVAIQDIIDANSLANPNSLEVDQQLIIPGSAGGDTAETPPDDSGDTGDDGAATGEQTHIVQAGENLFRIGLRYGFTVEELTSYNNLADPTRLEIGQVIKIPPGE